MNVRISVIAGPWPLSRNELLLNHGNDQILMPRHEPIRLCCLIEQDTPNWPQAAGKEGQKRAGNAKRSDRTLSLRTHAVHPTRFVRLRIIMPDECVRVQQNSEQEREARVGIESAWELQGLAPFLRHE